MNQLQIGILKAASYSAVFKYPLSFSEIIKYWIGNKTNFNLQELNRNLTELVENKKLILNKCFYTLPNYSTIDRTYRERLAVKKWLIAQKKSAILSKIPTVKMIAVTGSLAMSNSQKDDDIDFLIITSSGKLWLTRFFAVLLMEISGGRRHPLDQIVADKICLNMFLDEQCLKIPQKERDIFIAHEIAQMKLIFNRDQTYEKFVQQNLWVEKFLPNCFKGLNTRKVKMVARKNSGTGISGWLENQFFKLQLGKMKDRITSEIIESGKIRFHPNDCREEIISRYQEILLEQKI